jgi:hypothetical protein
MDLEATINRVRNEFLEMPGLRLSLPQAMRLWDTTGCGVSPSVGCLRNGLSTVVAVTPHPKSLARAF